jgi:hypothetical protein
MKQKLVIINTRPRPNINTKSRPNIVDTNQDRILLIRNQDRILLIQTKTKYY